ncbi:MAG TPA: 30S ribosome-binding factor RbfA [Ignavibacteria bacterium]
MGHRVEKVSEEIKHKLNTAMSRDLMELNLGLVTISKVIMSADLKFAKVYVSFLGNKEPAEKCVERLNYRKSHIRFLLAKQISLKYIPDLTFFHDDTMEYADKISKLINDLHKDNASS